MTTKQEPNPPTKFNFYRGAYLPVPGTEGWHLVSEFSTDDGHRWAAWRAYYSPSARLYFWHGDSGCSCNDWTSDLYTSSDFESGTRADAARGLRRFAEACGGYNISPAYALDADTKIRTFKGPKP